MENPSEPDMKRLATAAWLLDREGVPATVPNLANKLKWELNRTRIAAAAGAHRGKLKLKKGKP